ncbi:MAG: 2-oxo acid dehydrogenase subunit E2 [Holosporales bacterium]|jgi:pyruvate dehydrogenase E2 component (dihydrolipoamide acetyltransferase)|nr:2-oxo acid dehydrogenase subunit E2 [Holosporales bacterium]
MPIVLEMPAMSPTMKKGNLVTWCKNEGDVIDVGDVLAEIDTDKATMEIESIHRGVLEKILVVEGTKDVHINTPIAIIRQKSDTDDQIVILLETLGTGNKDAPTAPAKETIIKQVYPVIERIEGRRHVAQAPSCTERTAQDEQRIDEPANFRGQCIPAEQIKDIIKVKASPLAKRIAGLHGIDISTIIGTGPGGRIVKADVLKTRETGCNASETAFTETPLSDVKTLIAAKLTKAKNEVPHFYMTVAADVTDLLSLRKKISDLRGTKFTVTDFIIKAVALALRDVSNVNVTYHDGCIRRYMSIDISVAVATNFGLLTPIISNADKKDIREISAELRDLAKLAREKRLPASKMDGGTLTISNLGTHQIDSFYSIINIPQASILSIGPAIKTPIFDSNDEIKKAMIMKIGYAIDHRVIDGQDAAKFLEKITEFLNNPVTLVMPEFNGTLK